MELAGTYEYDESFAEQIAKALNKSYSDKASMHAYHTVYAHIFKDMNVENFLEIGLFLNELSHTDLNAWAQIFPNANIYGADKKNDQLFNLEKIKMYYVDQSNKSSLDALVQQLNIELDVILDDASHVYDNTVNTFESLFPLLRQGGVYLIEDILDYRENANNWQQTIDDLQLYMNSHNYNYEIFQSQKPSKVIDEVSGEPTDTDMPSDSYILCIYK